MEHNISILFYTKKSRKLKNSLLPVYLRITINGERIEQATKRSVHLSQWSSAAGKVKGTHPAAKILNGYLDTLRNKIYVVEREMIQDGIEITFESFRDKWLGVHKTRHMLLKVFEQHNDEVALLAGKEFSTTTLKRYKTSLEHTRNFIFWKFKLSDIDITNLNYEFISSYSFWLKSIRNCNHNTTMKYLTNFKKIVLICIKNGWINKDPFIGFKLSKHEVDRPFLTNTDLRAIESKEFSTSRLNYVKDIFLFSCYTGLAYVDVQKLKRSEVGIGVDGEKWIFIKRQKTDTPSRIPLLPTAENIIEKYENHQQCKIKDRILPVLSNQKMNAYLKEIADTCGIDKILTFAQQDIFCLVICR